MKGLKQQLVTSTLLSASMLAQAELSMLNDDAMGDVTGQAGLTIDIETKRQMGEFAYQDGGFILLQNVTVGGSKTAEEIAFSGGHGFLDNLRATIDIAGDGSTFSRGVADNQLSFGFSEMTDMANLHTTNGNTTSGMELAAGLTTGTPVDEVTGLDIDQKRVYGDGDLVIHLSYTDAWQKGGGFSAYATSGVGGDDGSGGTADLASLQYGAFRDIASRAVDFNQSWDAVGVASSDYVIGSQGLETFVNSTTGALNGTDHVTGIDLTSDTTTYLSGISVNGYLGPLDIHIANNGNGFGADGSGQNGLPGTGDADSKITGDLFFKVDYDIYVDIAGIQYSGIKFHNLRGDLSSMNLNAAGTDFTSSFGFAHGRRQIYAIKDNIINPDFDQMDTNPWVDGIGHNTEFKGDIDITAFSFGDTGTSIGSIYLTDVQLVRNWDISAH